jgi:hypothetical protein
LVLDRVCLQLFRGCQQVVDNGPGGVWIIVHLGKFSSRSPERLAAIIDSSRVETIKCEGRLRNLDVVSISINLLRLEIFRVALPAKPLRSLVLYRASYFA